MWGKEKIAKEREEEGGRGEVRKQGEAKLDERRGEEEKRRRGEEKKRRGIDKRNTRGEQHMKYKCWCWYLFVCLFFKYV